MNTSVSQRRALTIWRDLGAPAVGLDELRMGIEVEQEHTSDLREAGKIAMDHLREFPDYYTRLTKMEARAKAGLAPNPGELTVRLSPRQLDFYDDAQFGEFGVEVVPGGVRGTREMLLRLAGFYADDADPKSSGIEPSRRRNAREAAARIHEALAGRMEPNGHRPMPKVQASFNRHFDEAENMFPDIGTIALHEDDAAGSDNGAGSERQFGYCADENPIRIAFAPKTEKLPQAYVDGLMAHEFGHAIEFRYGVPHLEDLWGKLPKSIERRADRIAWHVFGVPIQYGKGDIQCIGCGGKATRPRRLG